MRIGICSDHRGYKSKKLLIEKLKKNYDIVDYGTDSEESVDYPDFAFKLGNAIKRGEVERGIAICGTGIGMSIALNKVNGIYCARVTSINDAILCREHNNANCIAFSEDVDIDTALEICNIFLNTNFETGEKYIRRFNKVVDKDNE